MRCLLLVSVTVVSARHHDRSQIFERVSLIRARLAPSRSESRKTCASSCRLTLRAPIERITVRSAHADYREQLDLLRQGELGPKRVFVTHGEPAARRKLRDTFEADPCWSILIEAQRSRVPRAYETGALAKP
ncbi:MAG: MBL fold metallo-hydrolase RNA specificity domain-containing protein [Polyangiaceae bacterium]